MAQPSLRNVRPVDPVLTNFSIGFRPAEMIGMIVAPFIEVVEQSGTVFKIVRDFALRIPDNLRRAPSGPYSRSGFTWSNFTYVTQEYGIEYPVPDVIEAASQAPISLQRKSTEMATKDLLLEYERQAAAEALNTSSKWASDTALSGTSQWDDFANSDPISDVDARKESILQNTGASPTDMYMGLQVWNKLKEHPLLLDKYKHTQRGILTQDLVAAAFDVPNLHVGRSVRNTAQEGAAFSGSFIWAKHAVLEVKEAPSVESRIGVVGFIWNEGGTSFPRGVEVYEEKQTRSNIVRSFAHWDIRIVETQYGQRIQDAVS